MTKTRTETDTFGPIEVDSSRYWGAQAERSLGNFKIGWEKQPQPVIRALGIVKRAAAEANMGLGKLDPMAVMYLAVDRHKPKAEPPRINRAALRARPREQQIVHLGSQQPPAIHLAREFRNLNGAIRHLQLQMLAPQRD